MSELIDYHVQRHSALRTDRSNFNSQWEEAAELVLPAHRDSFEGSSAQRVAGSQGQKKTEKQFDSTAAFAVQRFSSVIESLATPQSSNWSRVTLVDKTLRRNRAARMFMDDVNDLLFNYRYRPVGNFVGNSQQTYLSSGAFGNGILYVDQPDNQKGLRYRNIHLGEAYFAENHANIVDTVYRSFYLTARQLMQLFPENLPEEVLEAAKNANQSEKKFEVLHCVYPRQDYDPGRVDAKGKPFASLYILVDKKVLLRESGYDTFPYAITRYTQAPGEVYGRGPAQFVLPAIKVLNEQKKTVLKQGHRTVDPVLLSHDDDRLGTFSMRSGALNPGGINKDGKRMVDVLPTGNLAVGHEMMDIEKAIINDAFLITLFQILTDAPQMTATEVLERTREKGMLLAPTAGRLQAEFLGPLIERELDLLARQGLLPPLPSILQGAGGFEYKIEYDSPMSRMARTEKASGFIRSLNIAAEYTKMTGDPTPLDHFNFDVAMPDILDIQGAPTAWTRSMEQVEEIRAQRNQNAETQQVIEAAPAVASLAKTAAPTT